MGLRKKKRKGKERSRDKKVENREERRQTIFRKQRIFKIEQDRKRTQQNNIRISQFAAEQHIIINE